MIDFIVAYAAVRIQNLTFWIGLVFIPLIVFGLDSAALLLAIALTLFGDKTAKLASDRMAKKAESFLEERERAKQYETESEE